MAGASNVGIDLHKTTLTFGLTNIEGNLVNDVSMDTKCVNKITKFVSELPRPIHCAIESVGMYEWLWELLEPIVDKLVLADAVELRYRAGKRNASTDRVDAKFLSLLVWRNEVPEAFVPDKLTRQLRRLGRHWHGITELMTNLKIRMRWILMQHNFPGPDVITGPSAQKWFLAQGDHLDPLAQFTFSQMLETIEHLERQRVGIRRLIIEFSKMDKFRDDTELLKTVPGISEILAAIILAEVAGFQRFYSDDAIACYTGLTERTKESAGNHSPGHISKSGSPILRWALCEAANTLVRSDPIYRALYNRILRHTHVKAKAKVAMAQKLIRWLWKMHKTREPFKRGGSTGHTKNANIARLRAKAIIAPALA